MQVVSSNCMIKFKEKNHRLRDLSSCFKAWSVNEEVSVTSLKYFCISCRQKANEVKNQEQRWNLKIDELQNGLNLQSHQVFHGI